MKRLILIVWILIFTVPAILGGTLVRVQRERIASYRPVSATILGQEIEERTKRSFRDDRVRRVRTYRPVVRYRYEVAGEDYTADEVYPITVGLGGFGAKGVMQRIAEEFQRGEKVTAYVDPADPSRAFLLREASFLPYASLLGSVGVILASIGFAAHSIRRAKPKIKERVIIAILVFWIAFGVLTGAHYFFIDAPPYSWLAITFLTGYGALGVMALTQTTIEDKSSGLAGGLRLGSFLGFAGFVLALLAGIPVMGVCKALGWFGYEVGDPRWIGYMAVVSTGLLGSVGFVLGVIPMHAARSDPEADDGRKTGRRRSRAQPD